jgi:hypothetical protein
MRKRRLLIFFIVIFPVVILIINQYLFCPQYNFPVPRPFSGALIYNPYSGNNFSHWHKCNFHTHVRAWSGLTNGKGDAADAWNIYDSLGYDVHCISNYQNINQYNSDHTNYIPAYEHGFGILKNHQGVVGASQISWSNYFLPQTLANKQHILSELRKDDSAVVIINHPELRYAYTPADMQFLSGYDCLEVFPTCSMQEWDAALSAGKPVFIVANDDAHDVTDPTQVGRNCTWINVAEVNQNNILHALKTGNTYGMVVGRIPTETMDQKIAKVRAGLPMVTGVQVMNDSLRVSLNRHAAAFQFIGQNGKVLSTVEEDSVASYHLESSDTYVRTRIFFSDATEINLNPVLRYNGTLPANTIPLIDENKTFYMRVTGAIILLLVIFLPLMLRRRARERHSFS